MAVILIILGVIFMIILAGFSIQTSKVSELKKRIYYFDSTYLERRGSSCYDGKTIDYDVRSWDGGINWYAVDYDDKKQQLKVLGEAEVIYPNLLKHLKAWDTISEIAKSRIGSVNPSRDVAVDVLKDAGFSFNNSNKTNSLK